MFESSKPSADPDADRIWVTFGRFQPMTVGHALVFKKLKTLAGGRSDRYRIYASQSHDAKKNPLQWTDKIKWLKKIFPEHKASVQSDKKVITFFDVVKAVAADGHKNVGVVVGSDRIKEIETLLNKYNGKDYTLDSIKVASSGDRDPDADSVSGMSATKMRLAATDNDLKLFKKGLPTAFDDAEGLMNAVRTGLQLD